MTKPFDATTRQLIELGPADRLEFLGVRVADRGRLTILDSNLSTVSAEADKVISVDDPSPWLALLELQAGRDVRLDKRAHFYSTLLEHRHQIPVRSFVVLLRPAADGAELTGKLEQRYPSGDVYDTFVYHVVRIWEQPVETVLASGLTVLPLAPVSRVERGDVRGVLLAMSNRLEQETTPEQASSLWNSTRILMGLRYEKAEVEAIVQGVSAMLYGIRGIEESSVYQDIFQKGEAKGHAEGKAEGKAEGEAETARGILLELGEARFGPPSEAMRTQIASLTDPARLRRLVRSVYQVTSWDELLSIPGASPG